MLRSQVKIMFQSVCILQPDLTGKLFYEAISYEFVQYHDSYENVLSLVKKQA